MAEKSALRLIPGRDALLEWSSGSYNPKTYVEYNGLVYKAKISTSTTFVPSEWTIVGDLREVRVPNIASRNALTGSTPTSGTTGISIPILDNTNVLVLNASADPLVGSNQFARYNYNQGSASWLLLQVGTGSTSASTVTDYNVLTNKPPIISGITATAGAGLTGGISHSGGVPPNRATFSFAHADTSSQANVLGTGRTYVQQLKFDTFGHVTGATTSAWSHPDTSNQPTINNTGFTYIQSVQLDGDGHVQVLSSGTWSHPDTSSQGNVTNTGSTVIQSIQLDGAGHVIGISSAAVSSGGGGVNFGVNGNSGGLRAMPDSGVLQITGSSSAIQTVTTLNGLNVGVRINFVPAGSNGQLQLNSSGALGSGAGLLFTGTTLTTPNFKITSQPASGTTAEILTRNVSNGTIQRIGLNAIAALPINAIQYRTASGFGGNANWIYNPTSNALTLGTRTGTTGTNSIVVGTNSSAAANSFAMGNNARASGGPSLVVGDNVQATAINTFALGSNTIASGQHAIALGYAVEATGFAAIATNTLTRASGTGSFAGGRVVSGSILTTQRVIAAGDTSFNFSNVDAFQTVGHGALSNYSAILGGQNHNIEVGNDRAAIIGGSGIKLTGTTYISTVAVPQLAIFTTPAAGSTDDVLTWNPISKKVRKITQASLSAGSSAAGSASWVQFKANSGTGFAASANFTFVTGTSTLVASNMQIGTVPTSGSTTQILSRNVSTGVIERIGLNAIAALPINAIQYRTATGFGGHAEMVIDPTQRAVTIGTRGVGAIGLNSFVQGTNSVASGNYTTALGNSTQATQTYAHAEGSGTIASGATSHAEGENTKAGQQSHAEGVSTVANTRSHAQNYFTRAVGDASHAGGFGHDLTKPILASGQGSFNHSFNNINQTVGYGATALGSAILGGINHHIESANQGAVIIGGNFNRNTSTSALHSFIIGGNNNQISAAGAGTGGIIGGNGNQISATASRVVIIGGVSVNASTAIYDDHTIVQNLGIWATPAAGGTDDVLTWNATSKKIGKIAQTPPVIYTKVAYVSKNGVDLSAVVGNAAKPYLTVQAAVNALNALTPTATDRAVVYVMQGFYNEQVRLYPYVDLDFTDAHIDRLWDFNNITDNIINGGRVREFMISATSTIRASIKEIISNSITTLSCDFSSLDANTQAKIYLDVDYIFGGLRIGNAQIHINCKRFEGHYNIYHHGVSNSWFNVNYWLVKSTSHGIVTQNSGTGSTCIIKAGIINCGTGTGTTGMFTGGGNGKIYIHGDEIYGYNPCPVFDLSLIGFFNPSQFITLSGKIINRAIGNFSAVKVGQHGKIHFKSGTVLVAAGTGDSIESAVLKNVVALGPIYGKTAISGNVTIQLGTFTANSTYVE